MAAAARECQGIEGGADSRYCSAPSLDMSFIASTVDRMLPDISKELEASRDFEKMLEVALNLEFEGQRVAAAYDVSDDEGVGGASLTDMVKREMRRSKKFEQYLTDCISSNVAVS